MINLFFVTHDFSGVRTYTNELLGQLSKQSGITVHSVFMDSCDYKHFTVIRKENITNIYIPRVERKWKINMTKYAARCLDLMDTIIQHKEQVIFHLNYSLHVKLGTEAKRRYGVKLIYTYHFLPNSFTYFELFNTPIEEIQKKVNPFDAELINAVDQVICVTDFAKKMVAQILKKDIIKIVTIHNGLGNRSEIYSNREVTQNEIKREFGFREDDKIILFVGRFEERKGLKYLFRAFNKLCEKYLMARLVLAGDGEFEDTFNQIPGHWGRITFTGNISPEILTKLYSITHIGVIPSNYEQCSYVALEMMQHGLPIVVSGVPGLKELFADKKNALIVPVHKSKDGQMKTELYDAELAEALDTLLGNENLRQKLGENARKQWKQFFSVQQMGKATLKQYYELIEYPQNEIHVEQLKEEGQKATT
jgi:glycosyltransferase involved in cell wall biosynthesis